MIVLIKSIGKLLEALGAYLAARIDRNTQAVVDGTEARSIVAKELAIAAAKLVITDPSNVRAAAIHWMPHDVHGLTKDDSESR